MKAPSTKKRWDLVRELKEKLGVTRLPRNESTTLGTAQLEYILQKLNEGKSYEEAREEALRLIPKKEKRYRAPKPRVRPPAKPQEEQEHQEEETIEEDVKEAEEPPVKEEEEISEDEKELMDEIYQTLATGDAGIETLARLVISGMMDYFSAIMNSLQQLEEKIDKLRPASLTDVLQSLETLNKQSLLEYLKFIKVPQETIERLANKSEEEIRREIRKLVK